MYQHESMWQTPILTLLAISTGKLEQFPDGQFRSKKLMTTYAYSRDLYNYVSIQDAQSSMSYNVSNQQPINGVNI